MGLVTSRKSVIWMLMAQRSSVGCSSILPHNTSKKVTSPRMRLDSTFQDLWSSAVTGQRDFDPAQVAALPVGAQRYLRHAIAAGTPLASAARLTMHGEIKLKRWYA